MRDGDNCLAGPHILHLQTMAWSMYTRFVTPLLINAVFSAATHGPGHYCCRQYAPRPSVVEPV